VPRSPIAAPAPKTSARVALLSGCVAEVLRPEVTRAARLALERNGAEIVEVPDQGCCGALALHAGDRVASEALARANSLAFQAADVDFIATTAAGCGALLRQYGTAVATSPDVRDAAQGLARRARDVSEVLCELGMQAPAVPLRLPGPVAYHDACHLVHASKVTRAPRQVLSLALREPPVDLGENEICCGSAGSYNLERPTLARPLGDRKAELAQASGVAAIAVANLGCMLQIELALSRRGLALPVLHPVEFLARAYEPQRGAWSGADAEILREACPR
jgi:glycolate oxidase iron-sulfur subunit